LRRRRHGSCTLLLLPLLAALVAPASRIAVAAEPAAEEESLKVQADSYMGASQWSEALPLFSKLFALTHNAAYLWNVAVCKYKLALAGQATPDDAIATFDQYLTTPDVPAEDVRDAKHCIAELEALRTRQAAKSQGPASTAGPSGDVIAPSASRAAARRSQSTAARASRTLEGRQGSREANGKRAAALVTGLVGAGFVGAGVYFSVTTRSLETRVTSAPQFNPGDDSTGRTAHAMQFVMYGLGIAAFTAAGVLYYLARDAKEPPVALVPSVGAGFAGVTLSERFW
jgi:hypothetical protein